MCISAPSTTPYASPRIPHSGTKYRAPIIIPILYIIGAKEYTKNLLKDCKIPPRTLDMPKNIGDKNIIRVSPAVSFCFSASNPGPINLIIDPAREKRHNKYQSYLRRQIHLLKSWL